MVKITKPLFSEAASGNFAGVIQFVCGHFVKSIPDTSPISSESQRKQREKFLNGAAKWTNELTEENKNNWKAFFSVIREEPQCVDTILRMSGYDIWMLYWLKFGEGGWENYPNPPVIQI